MLFSRSVSRWKMIAVMFVAKVFQSLSTGLVWRINDLVEAVTKVFGGSWVVVVVLRWARERETTHPLQPFILREFSFILCLFFCCAVPGKSSIFFPWLCKNFLGVACFSFCRLYKARFLRRFILGSSNWAKVRSCFFPKPFIKIIGIFVSVHLVSSFILASQA